MIAIRTNEWHAPFYEHFSSQSSMICPYDRIGPQSEPDIGPRDIYLTSEIHPHTTTRAVGWVEESGLACRAVGSYSAAAPSCGGSDTVTRYRLVIQDDPYYRIWWCSVCDLRQVESRADWERWVRRYRSDLEQMIQQESVSMISGYLNYGLEDYKVVGHLRDELKRFEDEEGLRDFPRGERLFPDRIPRWP